MSMSRPDSIEGYRDGHYYLFSYSPGIHNGEVWGLWNGNTKRYRGVSEDQWFALKRRLTSVPADRLPLAGAEQLGMTPAAAEHYR